MLNQNMINQNMENQPTIYCVKCCEKKPEINFGKNRRNKLLDYCEDCGSNVKGCNTCYEIKLLSDGEFGKDGNRGNCRSCFNSYYKKDYLDQNGNRDRHKIRVGLNRISKGECTGNSSFNLGCTDTFFHQWLEYQRSLSPIEEEELDHGLPSKEFKDKPELCFAWFNMRPMEKTE
uniref:hypothetical protein n=1 Tax=Bartonella sp. CL42QHWL TaxID=3243528 RepID=UPI0035CFADCF